MNVPSLKLRSGPDIPQIALGLWQVKNTNEFDTMFDAAVKAGYRHFDSAQAYNNEHLLGVAIKRHNLDRKDLFITTKIAVQHFGYKHVKKSFVESLEKLQMDYVDLLLLHFPVTLLRKKSWLALEELQTTGKVKSIGVSNYTIKHLEQMKHYAKVSPAVNQVELHVFLQQPELLDYCHQHNIVVEAYSPLAHARDNDNAVIAKIAQKHGKSYAQIMLRWCVQQGLVVLPKSKTPRRLIENMAIFGFALDETDMQQLVGQNRDLRTCWNPTRVP